MYLIVGLGNPGDEYEHTRHNVAWIVLRDCLRAHGMSEPHSSSALSSDVSEGVLFTKDVRVLFPTTFMNHSGAAVKKALKETPNATLIVLQDEVDLPFGTIRVSEGRGAGGHNGVQSIIDQIGTKDFARIRIGVARKNIFGIVQRPKGDKLADFVLAPFTKKEMEALPEIGKKVDQALELILTKGVKEAMNSVNSK